MRRHKQTDLFRFGSIFLGVLAVNIIATRFFFRWDLTEDKRFSINEATVQMLETMERPVFVEVYLEGDFPAEFKRLQRSIKENLDEFKIYAGPKIQYVFMDPGEGRDKKQRNQFYMQLAQKGLQPTNLAYSEEGKRSEKIIFPGALIRQGEREIPVLFLKGNTTATPEQRLNQSVEGVEYELAMGIQRAVQKEKPLIAFVTGHGELDEKESFGIMDGLRETYRIDRVDLPTVSELKPYDAVLVCKPREPFSEPDKFKLDQYLMKGGNLLFFVDGVDVELDSIDPRGSLIMPYESNLTDLLFNYGLRIERNLVQDMFCAAIPMFTGYEGNTPITKPVRWPYFPVVNTYHGAHPITKNMDATYCQFISSVDTVKSVGAKKTPLLFSSKHARLKPAPVRVNFNEVRQGLDPKLYTRDSILLGVMVEGNFQSLYKNRLSPKTEEKFAPLQTSQEAGKVLLIADGDFVRNKINKSGGDAYPLGYDRISQFTFANLEFVQNALGYMMDQDGIILARNKEITLRPLDEPYLKENGTLIKAGNMVLPPLFVLLFGLGKFFFRRWRNSKP